VFTAEELRKAKIFACLDEAECARLTQTVADVRLKPGEWLFREGAPPSFYVLMEGRLRIALDVHGKQTEFVDQEFKQGDFLGEVPLLLGTPTFGSLRAQTSCRVARLDKQQFHRLIRDSKEARAIILETLGERLLLIQQRSLSLPTSRVLIFGHKGIRTAITSAHFFPRTVFLMSGSIVIAIRSGCLPASPTTLIARP
jgi:thioredoxin reductase (NADPH)